MDYEEALGDPRKHKEAVKPCSQLRHVVICYVDSVMMYGLTSCVSVCERVFW